MKQRLTMFLIIFSVLTVNTVTMADTPTIDPSINNANCLSPYIGTADGKPFDAETQEHGQTVHYIALWEAIKYKVTFDKNADGVSGDMPAEVEYTYDVSGTLPDNQYEKTDFDFIGWCKDSPTCATKVANGATVLNWRSTSSEDPVKLYAQWAPSCVAKLHFGNEEVCLYKTKISDEGKPSLAIRPKHQTYYTGMSTDDKVIHAGSSTKLRIMYGGQTYNVHDLTVTE